MQAWLFTEKGVGVVIPVREAVVLGRQSIWEPLVKDYMLSRHHARIEWVEGSLIVEDLGSRNGTSVNYMKLGKPTALKEGDLLSIGQITLRVTFSPDLFPITAVYKLLLLKTERFLDDRKSPDFNELLRSLLDGLDASCAAISTVGINGDVEFPFHVESAEQSPINISMDEMQRFIETGKTSRYPSIENESSKIDAGDRMDTRLMYCEVFVPLRWRGGVRALLGIRWNHETMMPLSRIIPALERIAAELEACEFLHTAVNGN